MPELSIIDSLERDVEELAKATVRDLIEQIGPITPKLTGLATGNWVVTIGNPFNGRIPRRDLFGGAVITAANVILGRSNNPFPVFWLTNNLDYIEFLNDGGSKKAPAKFVETAIKRTVNKKNL